MKNIKGFILLIIPTIICGMMFISCDSKQDDEDQVDINYPTTIYPLSEENIIRMRKDFAQRNPNMVSTINKFGFCSWGEDTIDAEGSSGVFTKEEAIEAVMAFAANNPETGITNSENLHFKQISNELGSKNLNSWVLLTKNQEFNDIEVSGTNLIFRIKNRALYFCTGNYYPNVYVPENFNFTVEQAKSKLLGKEVILTGWSGPYSLGKIKSDNMQESITGLIIVPLITEEKIELRVAWKIDLSSTMHYVFYVDVMTGEIIQEEATLIA